MEHSIHGRIHEFRLRSAPLAEANRWLARHQAFWENAAKELDLLLSEPGDAG